MRRWYDELSPDGAEHRPVVREKLLRMWSEEPRISPAELGSIRAPTLVMAGDRDVIPVEHTIELWRAIAGASLAIVPGANHLLLRETPDVTNAPTLAFLPAAGSTNRRRSNRRDSDR